MAISLLGALSACGFGDPASTGPCAGNLDCPSGTSCVAGTCRASGDTPAPVMDSATTDTTGGPTPNGNVDATVDASAEAGVDATADASADATRDPTLDASADTSVDASADASVDAMSVDAQPYDSSSRDGQDGDGGPVDGSDADVVTDAEGGPEPPPLGCRDGGGEASTLVLFGGGSAGGALGDTWVWNGVSWSQGPDASPSGPVARQEAALSSACGFAVLFGGLSGDNKILGDAWQWDGVAWAPQSSDGGPPPRHNGAAAIFGSNMLLLGGSDSNGLVAGNDPWVWDGRIWQQQLQTDAKPRQAPVLVGSQGGILLFGGATLRGIPFSDTWLRTGTTWASQPYPDGSSPPTARAAASAAAWGPKVVMFGGADARGNAFDDTWLWDGATWTQVPSQLPHPPARSAATMAVLGTQVVLVGGIAGATDNFTILGDTWIWNGQWSRGPDADASPSPARFSSTMTAF